MELWLEVPGWPGYEVSDLARVRSLPRFLADGRWTAGQILTASPDGHGYYCVTLCDGKRRRRARVHRLVALAWLGDPPPGKPQVRHLNGQGDNRPEVLAYGSQEDNERDKKDGRVQGDGRAERRGRHCDTGGPRALQAVS